VSNQEGKKQITITESGLDRNRNLFLFFDRLDGG